MLYNQQLATVELGWEFYIPVLVFVVMCGLAIPVWAAIGSAAIAMLILSGALPLSLVGESPVRRYRRVRADRDPAVHPDR